MAQPANTGSEAALSALRMVIWSVLFIARPLRCHPDLMHFLLPGSRMPRTASTVSVGSLNDSATPAAALLSLVAGPDGVVQVPLTKSGPWMLRSAYVARRAAASSSEWDVARGTYVFNVGTHH